MKIKIYFVEKTISFDSSDINSSTIAGSEKTLINITNELAKDENLIIKVFNNIDNEKTINKVQWININRINDSDVPNYLIAMSDANLLSLLNCKKKYLWSHSIQPIEKFIRKKQLIPFIKNKPVMLLEGIYHYKTRSFFTSIFGKKVIPIAPDYDFIETKINKEFIPPKKAIFTTRSDRNLLFLLDSWKKISTLCSNSSLYINPPFNLTSDYKNFGINLRVKGDKSELINELLNSRVMLNPGHKGEVFCLAAEEARELCLPIVTMGYGSLKERVDHGITGYIAKNKDEFVKYSAKILTDDDLYLKLKSNLMLKKSSRTYRNVAQDLLKIFYGN